MLFRILLFLGLFINFNSIAQYTAIPDNAFEQHLIDLGYDSGPLDNQVLTANIVNVTELTFDGVFLTITDLTGIEDFTSIEKLNCTLNDISVADFTSNTNLTHLSLVTDLNTLNLDNNINLTSLDLSGQNLVLDVEFNVNLDSLAYNSANVTPPDISNNVNLIYLKVANSYYQTIDLSNNVLLEKIIANVGELTSIDLSNNPELIYLTVDDNYLTELDLSNNPNLLYLYATNNPNLSYINAKNGNNLAINDIFDQDNFYISSSVTLMCIDDVTSNFTQNLNTQIGSIINFTEYCSLNPAQSNTILGNIKIDVDNNGCDINDENFEGVQIIATNGVNLFSTFTDANGDYLLYVDLGNYTVYTSSNVMYYTTAQNNQLTNFTDFGNTDNIDFCLVPIPNINDLGITFPPSTSPVPGSTYFQTVKYFNNGTTTLSGDVELIFDNSKLILVDASEIISTQNSNSVTINFSSITPNESREISFEFLVLTPPDANIGDEMKVSAIVTPIVNDSTPDDNIISDYNLTIGPFDPNDITVLEGAQVHFENASNYLNYNIRFQNTGSAPAINVVVETVLDPNLDWNTLEFINSSHSSVTSIENGNDVKFIFENINLPDSLNDEENSHGSVSYRIKPISAIQVGDDIDATASIFFDYNEAVVTNTANTVIVETGLNIKSNITTDLNYYPNPTSNSISFTCSNKINAVEFYNNIGSMVLQSSFANKVDVSHLSNGIYFCRVIYKNGKSEVVKLSKF